MRIIDPSALEMEKITYAYELINQHPYSFYIEHERACLERLYHILFHIKTECELKNIELMMNLFLKLVMVPFVFEHPVENELRGPILRDVVLIPTSFATGDFSIHRQELGVECGFFKVLNELHCSFTIENLTSKFLQQLKNKDVELIEKRILRIIKKMLYEQLVVVV